MRDYESKKKGLIQGINSLLSVKREAFEFLNELRKGYIDDYILNYIKNTKLLTKFDRRGAQGSIPSIEEVDFGDHRLLC